ncbi:hypothetical protein D3C73_1407710 [compost metagenome]
MPLKKVVTNIPPCSTNFLMLSATPGFSIYRTGATTSLYPDKSSEGLITSMPIFWS